ncbi:serine hydrolase domain-containing protein [Bacillus spongiae]|uniref:Serine hydrolase domain-containing protein n=1 Tax=Bacillus spongiae TaxID=2683610 RepID=A0ABU8HH05_9BACI
MENINKKVEQFEMYMDSIQKEKNFIGTTVAITYGNELIYAKGFGNARVETKQKLTPNTIMSIQSITKSFAAASIMYLVERGLLKLDSPLVDYLPYFQTSNKTESDNITVRQLLSHTAGLPGDLAMANLISPNRKEVLGFTEWQEEVGITDEEIEQINSLEDITRHFKHVDLAYVPGDRWMYCTDAYAIVGDLFEKVSGETWSEHIQQNLFNNLEMTRSTLDPEIAKGDLDSSRYYIENEQTAFPTNPIAAPIGFIYSSAIDMAKYLAASMGEKEGSFLSIDSLKEMQKPFPNVEVTLPFNDVTDNGYGLGWGSCQYKGLTLIEHGGGYTGVRTWVSMVPNEKVGIVVLSNYQESNAREIAMRGIDIFLDLL